MTEPGDDFETFLKTRTVLPNGMSDDDKLEPPKALDAIVLNEAREAIRARQQPNRTARWATPVALAATILLCLSIVLNVSLNTNRPTANLRRMSAATADKASPTPAAPASEEQRRENVEPAMPAPDEPVPANSYAAQKTDALANRSGGQPAQTSSEAPSAADSATGKVSRLADRSGTATPAPSAALGGANSAADKPTQLAGRSGGLAQAPTDGQAASDSTSDSVTTVATPGYAGTVPARAPATPTREAAASLASGAATNAPLRSAVAPTTPTPSVMASVAPSPPAPAPAVPSSSAGVPADQLTSVTVTGARRSRADARTAASSPSMSGTTPSAAAAASPPAVAAATPPTPVAATAAADNGAAASGLEGASHATPGRSREGRPGPTPSGRMPALEEAVVAQRKAAAPHHPKDPKIWLQQIAALRSEGKAAQADAEMRRFLAIFPAYPAKPGPSTPSEPPK
jgi:hypothetical protein